MMIPQNIRKNWPLIASMMGNAVCIFIVLFFFVTEHSNDFTITHEKNSAYTFINPILDCEEASDRNSSKIIYADAENKMDAIKSQYGLQDLAVYYRDLNTGPWFGYNEKKEFVPASLLKVPIMISFLKYAEYYPGLLDTQITISDADTKSRVTPITTSNKKLEVGSTYSLLDVVKYMIQESDNTGVGVLMRNFDEEKYTTEVYRSVGVDIQKFGGGSELRVKDYAGFFRVLYNASYLSKDSSEFALHILANTSFTEGIVAGVPAGINVAHKFGERIIDRGIAIDGTDTLNQFHDCGIVYYPESPYVICIMTRGEDYQKQIKAISTISKYFYEQVSKK